MELSKVILRGIHVGVERHWRYAKDYLRVKPEYLLTISVADELSKGFENKDGLDIAIKLEEPTNKIVVHLWMDALGWTRYWKEKVPWQGRNGNVDILLECDKERHIVELKNFNPSATEVKKELVRINHLFEINSGNNALQSCHIAFPATANKESWLQKQARKVIHDNILKYKTAARYEDTNEDPENGIPFYYCNIISITRSRTKLT
jgi:hypothetical protein